MKKIILLILVILWMGVIFYFSSFNGKLSALQSDSLTQRLVDGFCNMFDIEIEENIKENTIEIIRYLVRKVAHIIEYFILCILVSSLLKCYSIPINKLLILTFIICYVYACSDEVHQLFISERSGSFIDTLIDSIGILLWLLIIKLKGVKGND